MSLKRIAVVEPIILPGGGTEAVAAWTIEALKKDYDVSLITYSDVGAEMFNRYYGTELEDQQYSTVHPWLPSMLIKTNRLSLLKDHLMMRYCKSVRKDFDLFICIGGVMDFGDPGMQYVAFAPASTFVKIVGHDPGTPLWYYLAKKTIMKAFASLSRYSERSMKKNVTLATSDWTGKLLENMYGLENYEVVFPPVDSPESGLPWEQRENGFLCIARLVPEKMIDQAIEILKRVREQGFDVTFHVVGRRDDPSYYKKVKDLCEENGDWATLHGVLSKKDLFDLMGRNKFGINAAFEEPSGVAALEMVKAGNIVFVRDGGGLPEIVDMPALTYSNVEDGVDKIVGVLRSESSQKTILSDLELRGETFSTQVFSETMQRAAEQFFSQTRETEGAEANLKVSGESQTRRQDEIQN